VHLLEGVTARIVVRSPNGEVWLSDAEGVYSPLPKENRSQGAWSWDRQFGDATEPTVTLRIWQGSGSVTIDDKSHIPTETETKP
jgi:hypothetical protein